jgi:hypothetical protein
MEEEAKMSDAKSKKPDLGLRIGIAAVVINIVTVSVYLYQAYIMQEQQHASAWPYVEWLPSFNEETYFIEITNNGIGPAIIKNMNIQLDGKQVANLDSLFMQLIGTTYFPHLTSTVQNRVLPPGKSIRLFQINNNKWANIVFGQMQTHQFKMSICYASVYGDAWTSEGTEVKESKCP